MIDTISLVCSILLKDEIKRKLENAAEYFESWTLETKQGRRIGPNVENVFTQEESGIRAECLDGYLTRVQVSLSRLLNGSNGVSIKTPAELRYARAKLMDELRYLVGAPKPEQFRLTRLDLALNLHLNVQRTLLLHRNARHRRIRNQTSQWTNTEDSDTEFKRKTVGENELILEGKLMRIRLYDKRMEEIGKLKKLSDQRSRALRIEIQYRESQFIAREFGWEIPLTLRDLRFEACYRVWREGVIGLQPSKMPLGRPNLAALVALCDLDGVRLPGGTDVMDWYRASVKPKQYSETRREVNSYKFAFWKFSWEKRLPKDRLPPIMDVDRNGNETAVPDPYIFRTKKATKS